MRFENEKKIEEYDAALSSAPSLLKFCGSSGTGMALQYSQLHNQSGQEWLSEWLYQNVRVFVRNVVRNDTSRRRQVMK